MAGPGTPEPDDVDRIRPVARDQHVAGLAPHHLPRHPTGPQPALIILHRLGVAIETDHLQVIGSGKLPSVSVESPVVRMLDLMAVLEGLLKSRTHTGCRSPRPARPGWPGSQADRRPDGPGRHSPVQAPHRGPSSSAGNRIRPRRGGRDGRAGVQRVLAQLAPQHVLRRQVVDELRVGLIVRPSRPGPAVSQTVADGHRQRPVGVLGTRRLRRRPPLVTQVVSKVPLELRQRVPTHRPCDSRPTAINRT